MKLRLLASFVLLLLLVVGGWFYSRTAGEVVPPTAATRTELAEWPQPAAPAEAASSGAADDDQAAALSRVAVEPAAAGVGGDAGAAVSVLTARLVDLDGQPLASMVVRVDRIRSGPARGASDADGAPPTVTSDAAGRIEFRLPSTESRALQLDDEAFVFVEPQRHDGSDGSRDLGELRVAPASRIAGVVRDIAGRPVADVRVAFGGVGPFGARHQTQSGADGTFAIERLRPGRWIIRTESSRFLPASVELELDAGQERSDVVVTVERGLSITGRVVDDRGVGVAGAKVASLRRELVQGVEVERFSDAEAAVTGADGSFVLGGLESGLSIIKATSRGHASVSRSDIESGAADVVIELQRLASIAGVVVGTDGKPITGSRVEAHSVPAADAAASQSAPALSGLAAMDFGGRMVRATTDAGGRFVLDGVRPGVVAIDVTGASHRPARRDGLRVLPAQQLTDVRVHADLGAVAQVTVVDEHDAPIAQARVKIERYAPPGPAGGGGGGRTITASAGRVMRVGEGGELGSAVSGDDGVATVAGLPAGEVLVSVEHDAFAPTEGLRLVMPAAGVVAARVSMTVPGYAALQVLRADQSAAPAAQVVLRRSPVTGADEPTRVDDAVTDENGRIRFGPLPAGSYSAVLVRQPQRHEFGDMSFVAAGIGGSIESSAVSFDVVAGQTTAVVLEVPTLATLHGRVVVGGEPLAGCMLELEPIEKDAPPMGFGGEPARSDANGEFRFEGLESGRYELRYGKTGQLLKARTEVVVPDNVTEVRCDVALRVGTVRAQVQAAGSGEPIANADVTLQRAVADGRPTQQRMVMVSMTIGDSGGGDARSMTFGDNRVQTDSRGFVTFDDVPVGEYTMRVESRDHAPATRDGVVVVEGQVTDCGVLEMTGAGHVRGRLVGVDGATVEMAMVEVRAVGDPKWDRREFARSGAYQVTGLAPGRYELRVYRLGLSVGEKSEPIVVDVAVGKTTDQDLVVPD